MLHGADLDSLHLIPESLTLLVQHPSPRAEHPLPPHRPQSTGQQTSDASYPERPFEQVLRSSELSSELSPELSSELSSSARKGSYGARNVDQADR